MIAASSPAPARSGPFALAVTVALTFILLAAAGTAWAALARWRYWRQRKRAWLREPQDSSENGGQP